MPIWVAAPLATWVAEALIQHVTIFNSTFTTQGSAAWRWTSLIQVAEIGGVQLVSAVIASVAAGVHHLGAAWLRDGRAGLRQRGAWLPLAVGMAALVTSLSFGAWRVGTMELKPGPRVALVQGGIPMARRLDPSLGPAAEWPEVCLGPGSTASDEAFRLGITRMTPRTAPEFQPGGVLHVRELLVPASSE